MSETRTETFGEKSGSGSGPDAGSGSSPSTANPGKVDGQSQDSQNANQASGSRRLPNSASSHKTLALNFSSQPKDVQAKQAKEMVARLAAIPSENFRSEAALMNSLRTLRNCIQSSHDAARVFAKAGAIQMLLKRLEMKFKNQVMLLQIFAALGYLVQHSEERAEIFVKENGIDVLVNLLRSEESSEGILLLGVQVITFVVFNSKQRLELLQAKRGIDTMCTVLQRGCVRSSLLNERATSLLSDLIDLNPRRGPALCCRLLKRIGQLVSQHDTVEASEAFGNSQKPLKSSEHTNDQLIILVQSLGYLLERQPDRCDAVLGSRGADVFFKLMDVNWSSSFLIETVAWTLSYCIENDKGRTLKVEELEASTKLLDVIRFSKTSEGLMCACARSLHHIISALSTDPVHRPTSERICKDLGQILALSAKEPLSSKSTYATPNAMRVVRQLLQLKGPCFEVFVRVGVLETLVSLLEGIVELQRLGASERKVVLSKKNVQQDVLQELGLLVEGDYRSALALAQLGALELLSVVVRSAQSSNILCSATRALACFVEHSGDNGAVITDIATNVSCDKALLELITESDNRPDVDDEVLLNTVGALGYMVKRQKSEKVDPPIFGSSSSAPLPQSLMKSNTEGLNRRKNACRALVSILGRKRASESLLWNVTWALIYLMDEGEAVECVEAVVAADGFTALKTLMQRENASPSILNSAARALCALLKIYPDKTKTLTIQIRMALLSISIRGEMDDKMESSESGFAREQGNTNECPILKLDIDPANIADSSICALDAISPSKLRSKGIRIRYTSKDMDQVGIDAGGLRRDWLSRLSAEIFDPKFNLVIWGFNPPDSVQISPDPTFGDLQKGELRQYYRMMGRVLGLSILYQDPLGVALAPPVTKLIFGEEPDFEDIKHVSEEYYMTFSNLNRKRASDKASFEEALSSLTFSVNSRSSMMYKAFDRNNALEEAYRQKVIDSKAKPCPSVRKEIVYNKKFSSLEQITEALAVAREKKDRDAIACLTKIQVAYLEHRDKGLDNSLFDAANIIDAHKKEAQARARAEEERDRVRKRERSRSIASEADETNSKRQRSHDQSFMCSQHGLKRMVSSVVHDQEGENQTINAQNYDMYLKHLTHKLIVQNSEEQIKFLQEGLYEIISKELLHKFLKSEEFAQLIEGDRDISVASWKQHTQYRGGDESTKQVQWFWDYVGQLDRKARQKVLQWSTGWRSIGKSGFGHRKFTIELTSVSTQAEDERLPSVATCGFHMWLPKYSKKEQLHKKFERAISETAFGNC